MAIFQILRYFCSSTKLFKFLMMKKRIFALLCIAVFCSHDMYLKMDTYFLQPNKKSNIQLFNGTFDKSENVIDRDRMLDVSLVGNGKRTKVEDNQWSEKDSITILSFKSGNEGTWVAGLSTKSRDFAMTADKFNAYLEHDGLLDMLSQRKTNNTLAQDAFERYSKHVKAIFQVGDQKSDDWNTVLGYPIEFVPMQNPYDLHTGDKIQIKLLREGKPLANQLVYVDFKAQKNGHSHTNTADHSHDLSDESHSHGNEKHSHSDQKEHAHENETHQHNENDETHSHSDEKEHSHKDTNENHTHTTGQKLRTNSEGIVSVNLTNDGVWYVRTIHLVNSEEDNLTHESNWSTLTFEIKHSHSNTEIADHTHDDEGIPSYLFWILSAVVVAILFFWFNRKK
jgi:uncharacterized GH25 family protein